MGLFSKKEVKEGAIIDSDEDVQWHVDNQGDENRYVVVRSKFTDFNNSKFLNRVNELINTSIKRQQPNQNCQYTTYTYLYLPIFRCYMYYIITLINSITLFYFKYTIRLF